MKIPRKRAKPPDPYAGVDTFTADVARELLAKNPKVTTSSEAILMATELLTRVAAMPQTIPTPPAALSLAEYREKILYRPHQPARFGYQDLYQRYYDAILPAPLPGKLDSQDAEYAGDPYDEVSLLPTDKGGDELRHAARNRARAVLRREALLEVWDVIDEPWARKVAKREREEGALSRRHRQTLTKCAVVSLGLGQEIGAMREEVRVQVQATARAQAERDRYRKRVLGIGPAEWT